MPDVARADGFGNRDNFMIATYSHFGGLDLYPASLIYRQTG